MKRAGAFSLALILGSMTALAQSSGRNGTQPTVILGAPGSTNCPIGVQAQRQAGMGQMLPTGRKQPQGPLQDLHLTLVNPTFAEIVGLRMTAYGLNSKGQLSPAQMTIAQSAAMKKTLDLKLKVDPKSQASTDLLLAGFTSVTFLHVDSIRYADGSTWTPSATHTCNVVPNGMMLISHR